MRVGLSGQGARRLGTWVRNAALVAGAGAVGGAASVVWLSRIKARGLESRPDPAKTYAEALERLARLQAAEDDQISQVCRTRGLLHGKRTERVVILVHGLTNCPQ